MGRKRMAETSEIIAVRGIIQSACAVYLRKLTAERGGVRRQIDAAKKLGYEHDKWDKQLVYVNAAESALADMVSLAERPGWVQAVIEDLRSLSHAEE